MQKTRVFDLEYYKIDSSLPDLVSTNDNTGIDLYAREDTLVLPTFALAEVKVSNVIRPGQNKPDSYFAPCQVNPPTKVPLNVVINGKQTMAYMLYNRSSNPKMNLYLANAVGVIDPSYNGINDEICAMMLNYSAVPVMVKKGQRIAQLVVFEKPYVNLKNVPEHWGSESRGGFGSTGKFEIKKAG